MDIFAQKKLLVRLFVILVAVNLISLGFFVFKDYFRKPPPPPQNNNVIENKDVSDILKKELNLTEKQTEQIKQIRANFPEKEKVLREVLNKERDSINAAIFSKNANEELIKGLARRIADNEYQVELLRYEQAKELKNVCTPEQLEKFQTLVNEIRDYFRGKPQKPLTK